jgi:hypothetical protein
MEGNEIKQFEPDTIVRLKRSGVFAKIYKRCYCGNANTPIHYEAWVEDRDGISIVDHDEVELECLPLPKKAE